MSAVAEAVVTLRRPARALQQRLLERAADAQDAATLALAGVLGAAFETHGTDRLPLPGLDGAATLALLDQVFPGARASLRLEPLRMRPRAEARADEIDDVALLLLENASRDRDPRLARWLAQALACACLGQSHLWQDLRLPARRQLTQLLHDWFAPLAVRNTRDMKWKKFFYKQLCERAELFICRAPSCDVCCDYANCYGSEAQD